MKSTLVRLAMLLVLSACACAIPLLSVHAPLLENEGIYFSVTQELEHGARLYTDIWDHKPPLLFFQAHLTQALRTTDPEDARRALGLVHLLIAIFSGAIAVRLSSERKLFWYAAFGYMCLSLAPVFVPWAFEADLLMLPWLLAAILAATYDSFGIWVLAGCLWAVAFFTKQTAVFYLPMFLVLRKHDKVAGGGAFLIGADLVALAVLAPFAHDGRTADFWQAVSGYGSTYVEGGWATLGPGQSPRLWHCLIIPTLSIYGVLASYAYGRMRLSARRFWLNPAWAWVGCAVAGCSFTGRFFNYYCVVLLPPAAVFLAPGLTGNYGPGFRRWAWASVLVPVGSAALSLVLFGSYRTINYIRPLWHAEAAKVQGLALKPLALAAPKDRLLIWGSKPQIYVYSGLRVYEGHSLFLSHLHSIPGQLEKLQVRMGTDPSEWVLVTSELTLPTWMPPLLEKDYVEVPAIERDSQDRLYHLRQSVH